MCKLKIKRQASNFFKKKLPDRCFPDSGVLFSCSFVASFQVTTTSMIESIFNKVCYLTKYKLHCRYLMLKFSKILILRCRKIFSVFYHILHETFCNSCDFPPMQEFMHQVIRVWQLPLFKHLLYLFSPHLVYYDRKQFSSILTDMRNLSHSK